MKDLHKIFALYIGCDILYKYIDEYYIVKLDMISNTNCSISHGYFDDTVFIEYQDCKLILKPLKKITERDACLAISNGKNNNRGDVGEACFWSMWQSWDFYYKDQLRELGYDCGYKDIPKLLETDVAITMEEAKKLKEGGSCFISDCINGDTLLSEIDDYIDSWHNSDSGMSLHEFLGMTEGEYALYMEDEQYLATIVTAREEAKKLIKKI